MVSATVSGAASIVAVVAPALWLVTRAIQLLPDGRTLRPEMEAAEAAQSASATDVPAVAIVMVVVVMSSVVTNAPGGFLRRERTCRDPAEDKDDEETTVKKISSHGRHRAEN